jgi:opacity protein-like surface antigen
MTAAAHAADPPGAWLPEFKKPFYTDLISGWYVRGDLGYRTNRVGAVDAPAPDTVTASTVQDTFAVGAGAGYKYKWFRSDVTVDFAKRAQFYGDTAASSQFYSVKIDALTVLANAYLDLGNWGGFTPYVGAGVGMTNLRAHEYTTSVVWEGVNDGRKWNPSWALMGGVSYKFSPSLLLDLSYRYLNLGEVATGLLPPDYTSRVTFRDMTAQEIRLGFRWMLD